VTFVLLRRKKETSPHRKIRQFLVGTKEWEQGWHLYRHLTRMPLERRRRKSEVLCSVCIEFKLDRHQGSRLLDRLEALIRNELGEKGFSVVLPTPTEHKPAPKKPK